MDRTRARIGIPTQRLSPAIPFIASVLLGHKPMGELQRDGFVFMRYLPFRGEQSLHFVRCRGEIGHELGVWAVVAILGLTLWRVEIPADQRKVETAQNRPVMQEVRPLPLLGVAGNLHAFHRQVARPLEVGRGNGL